jgi:hypothetical protein
LVAFEFPFDLLVGIILEDLKLLIKLKQVTPTLLQLVLKDLIHQLKLPVILFNILDLHSYSILISKGILDEVQQFASLWVIDFDLDLMELEGFNVFGVEFCEAF